MRGQVVGVHQPARLTHLHFAVCSQARRRRSIGRSSERDKPRGRRSLLVVGDLEGEGEGEGGLVEGGGEVEGGVGEEGVKEGDGGGEEEEAVHT